MLTGLRPQEFSLCSVRSGTLKHDITMTFSMFIHSPELGPLLFGRAEGAPSRASTSRA